MIRKGIDLSLLGKTADHTVGQIVPVQAGLFRVTVIEHHPTWK